MAHARGQGGDVDLALEIDLLRRLELEKLGRQLDLDDVRAEERRHVRGIGADVDRRLALPRQRAAARIGPDHHRQPVRLGLATDLGDFLHHVVGGIGAGIDGEADGGAAQAQRVLDAPRHRLRRSFLGARQAVGRVHLEDERNGAGEGIGAGLDEPERRGVGREARLQRELEMIVRVIGRRIGREAPRRAMLEALVDRQDHQPAAAAEPALHEDAGEVGLGAGIVALVGGQDLPDPFRDLHGRTPGERGLPRAPI